jgi:hypothetical protein
MLVKNGLLREYDGLAHEHAFDGTHVILSSYFVASELTMLARILA